LTGVNSGASPFFNQDMFHPFFGASLGPAASRVAAGDFNGDGYDDMAFVDFAANRVAIAVMDKALTDYRS